MPESLAGNVNAAAGSRQYSVDIGLTAESSQNFSPSVPVAWLGTLTTRTDANTGEITMDDADHEIDTGDRLMLYWEADDDLGNAAGHRRFVLAGTVSGTAVPIDLGAGDNLPVDETPNITVCVMEQITAVLTGDDVVAIMLNSSGATFTDFVFMNSTTEHLHVQLDVNEAYIWASTLGTTNPIAGDSILSIWAGHSSTDAAQTCPGTVMFN